VGGLMFKKLMDFSYKRTALEAIGFYLAYFLFFLFTLAIIGGFHSALTHPTSQQETLQTGHKIGLVFSVILCPLISFVILAKKKLLNNVFYIIVALLSGLLALPLGAILGLIPAAFLTTRPSK